MVSNKDLLMAVRGLDPVGPWTTIPCGDPLCPVAMGRLEEAIYEVASNTHVQFRFITV